MVAPLILAAYAASTAVKSKKEELRREESEKIQLVGPDGPIKTSDPLYKQYLDDGLIFIKHGDQFTQKKVKSPDNNSQISELFYSNKGDWNGVLTAAEIANRHPNGYPENQLVYGGKQIITVQKDGTLKTDFDLLPEFALGLDKESGKDKTTTLFAAPKKKQTTSDKPEIGYFPNMASALADETILKDQIEKISGVGLDRAKELVGPNFADLVFAGKSEGFVELPKKDDEEGVTEPLTRFLEFVDKEGNVKEIEVDKYSENMGKPLTTADGKKTIYTYNEKGVRQYGESKLNLSIAARQANGEIDVYNLTDTEGEKVQIIMKVKDFQKYPTSYMTSIETQLQNTLPKLDNGALDYSKMPEKDRDNLRATIATKFMEGLAKGNSDDPERGSGLMMVGRTRLNAAIGLFEVLHRGLASLPGMKEAIKAAQGQLQVDDVNRVINEFNESTDGTPQAVIPVDVSTQVPASDVLDDRYIIPRDTTSMAGADMNNRVPADLPLSMSTTMPIVLTPEQKEIQSKLQNLHLDNADVSQEKLNQYHTEHTANLKLYVPGTMNAQENNPKINIIDELYNTPVTGSDQKGIGLVMGVKFASGFPTAAADVGFLTSVFKRNTGLDYRMSHAVLMALQSPKTGNLVFLDIYEENFMAKQQGKSFEDYQQASAAKDGSSLASADLLGKMMTTYFNPVSKKFTNLNSKIGTNVYMPYVFAKQQLQSIASKIPVIGDFISGTDAAVQKANSSFYGADGFSSVLDSGNPELIKQAAMRQNLSVAEYTRRERAAREDLQKRFAKDTAGLTSSDAEAQNIALRNYYRYMAAYTMAAAIQGGTGGRTISDQDVQNILNALAPGSYFITAEAEYRILQAAQEMMLESHQFHRHISKGTPREIMAAFQYATLSGESLNSPYGMTSMNLADRLRPIVNAEIPTEFRTVGSGATGTDADIPNPPVPQLTKEDVKPNDLKLKSVQLKYAIAGGQNANNLTLDMLIDRFGEAEALTMIQEARQEED
jgi:hypothetical protein|tara:strand:- start:4388 stop:7387 length:3000 start_codon:yes stop_codon:yes gene_type:complete